MTNDTLESVSATAVSLARVWGPEASQQSMAALRTRSASRRRAAVRAALRALAMRPEGGETPTAMRHMHDLLDAWLARMVQAGTGAAGVAPPDGWQQRLPAACRGIVIEPRSMGNEVGALTTRLSFALGSDWTFPVTATAREECACSDALPAAAAQEKRPPLWPSDIFRRLVTEYKTWQVGNDFTRCRDAAIALAAAVGLPITLTASIRVAEVTSTWDAPARREGVIIGLQSRALQGGRKVERRRAAAPTGTSSGTRVAWTASSCAVTAARFIPWMRVRAVKGPDAYLFPRFALRGGSRTIDETGHLSQRHLTARLKELFGDTQQFHDIRRGVENALELVHRQFPDVPETTREVKNAIGLRSNKPLRGSRDSYVRDSVDELFAATRRLHEVTGRTEGGLLRGQPAAAAPQEPFDTDCQRCGVHIPAEESGALCDVEGCNWCLCVKCFPGNDELLCPEHSNGSDTDSSSDSDASPSDSDDSSPSD